MDIERLCKEQSNNWTHLYSRMITLKGMSGPLEDSILMTPIAAGVNHLQASNVSDQLCSRSAVSQLVVLILFRIADGLWSVFSDGDLDALSRKCLAQRSALNYARKLLGAKDLKPFAVGRREHRSFSSVQLGSRAARGWQVFCANVYEAALEPKNAFRTD